MMGMMAAPTVTGTAMMMILERILPAGSLSPGTDSAHLCIIPFRFFRNTIAMATRPQTAPIAAPEVAPAAAYLRPYGRSSRARARPQTTRNSCSMTWEKAVGVMS